MSRLNEATILSRIDQLLSTELPNDNAENNYSRVVEVFNATLTLTTTLYGQSAPQVKTLHDALKEVRAASGFETENFVYVLPAVQGVLRAAKADVQSGMVGSLTLRVTGEVLADMLTLAKEALGVGSSGGRNVAAVLAAASFEDTIRKMGETLAGVSGRPALADVLTQLKAAKVLEGAPFTTAQSYLKFRNDALHADWTKLDDATVASCISFVEHLILRHFS